MRKRKIASAVAYVLIFAIAIALFNGTTSFAAETIASGTCGANATWTLDSDGLLVISGTGETSAFQCDEGVWTSYKNKVKRVVVEDGITSLYSGMFKDCVWLMGVSIPDSVLKMGSSFGGGVFEGCVRLTSIDIPNSVTSIGGAAFRGCSSLTTITIPESVTSIGTYAFSGCSSLKAVIIPNSVTRIGEYAFDGCSSLATITIPEGVTSIGDGTFRNCSNLTSINIPDEITSVGNYAFYGCSSLTELTIPYGVTSIGISAFFHCSKLNSVTIPESVAGIGAGAFSGCSGLIEMTIPESVTSIGGDSFSSCIRLERITIPDTVISIGGAAFSGCSSLTEISIPDGVTSIEGYSFSGCNSLKKITIPDTVTSIGYDAFRGCSSLTEVIIPKDVASIGSDAFRGCSSLTTITIPEGVGKIEERTFRGCSSLTTIIIPKSVTHIYSIIYGCSCNSDDAFYGCNSLSTVSVPSRGIYAETWALDNHYCVHILDEDVIIGHNWSAPTYTWSEDNKTCTATRVCQNDASHVETETVNTTSEVIQPTCTTLGTTKYTATFASEAFVTQTKTENGEEATGHNWSAPNYTWSADGKTCTATRVCQNDANHVETETVNATSEVIQPTCTTPGTTKYTATFASEAFATQIKTENDEAALGHNWSAPTYTWSADGKTCTATRVCQNDPSHVETETVNATSQVVTPATFSSKGTTEYKAIFTKSAFTSQTKQVQDISMLTHTYSNPTFKWSADGSSCTVTYTCDGKNCGTGNAHTDTHKCTVTKSVLTPATCTKKGVTRYTAVAPYGGFKSYKNVADIPMDAHSTVTKTTPATAKADGKVVHVCKTCGTTVKTTKINKIASNTLNVAKVTFTGNVAKPTVKVLDSAGKVINPKYYTVTTTNKAVGPATAKIVFKTLYKGTLTKAFTIVPKNTAISAATSPKKGSLKAKWIMPDTKNLKQMTGYMLQVSTDPKFKKNVKTAVVKKPTITTNTIKGLKKGKYYVRIRTYKTINKTNYYSNWKNYNRAVVVK